MTALVVLAGGRGTRLGEVDKAVIPLAGRTLLDHVLDRVRGQADSIAINANGDPARFARFGLPVIADPMPGFPGPLAGIVAAMQWAAAQGETEVATVPVDTPFLPVDLLVRLRAIRDATGASVLCGRSGGRAHPVAALWPIRLADTLILSLLSGERRVDRWVDAYGDYPSEPIDPFFNVNTPEQRRFAEKLLECPSASRPTQRHPDTP